MTTTGARLNGNLTSTGGAATTVKVHWGTENKGEGTWPNVVNLGTPGVGTFHTDISGLADGTTYYFRVSASNSAGLTWGTVLDFTTPVAVTPM